MSARRLGNTHYPAGVTKADYYELATLEDLTVEDLVIESEDFPDYSGGDSVRRMLCTVGEANFVPLDFRMVRMLHSYISADSSRNGSPEPPTTAPK